MSNEATDTPEGYFERQVREVIEQRRQRLPLIEHIGVMVEMLVCQLAGIRDELAIGNQIMDREPEVEPQKQDSDKLRFDCVECGEEFYSTTEQIHCPECGDKVGYKLCLKCKFNTPGQYCPHCKADKSITCLSQIDPDPRSGWQQSGRHG